MKITTLVENTRLAGRKDLHAEHGLCLHVQLKDKQILFDTGSTAAFGINAHLLGIRIEDVDIAILSHHHLDHGGGLNHFLEKNSKAKIFLRRQKEGKFYFRILGPIMKNVSLDMELFQRHPERFCFVGGPIEISPQISILNNVEMTHPQPKGNSRLFVREGKEDKPDDFAHELVVLLKEGDQTCLLTGCSHKGILNLIEAAMRYSPNQPINAVMGGFHLTGIPIMNLMATSKREVQILGKELLALPVKKYYTGHCTGEKAYRVLKGILGDRLEYLPTGISIEI